MEPSHEKMIENLARKLHKDRFGYTVGWELELAEARRIILGLQNKPKEKKQKGKK